MRNTMRMSVRTVDLDRTAVADPAPRRVPVNLTLPEDLVEALDRVAGPRQRSAFAEEAIRKAIRREKLRLSIEQTAGSLPAQRYPHWRTSRDVVEWVREMRAEVTTADPNP